METHNTIPTPATDFKQQQDQHSSLSTLQLNSKSSINTEPHCWLTGKDDLDLDSLLMFPTPANREQDYFTGDPSWELLASLEQPILQDMDLIDHLEANLPDEIHYWNGFQKDANYQTDIKEPKVDPDSFGSNPMMEQQTQQYTLAPMDQSRTMSYDISPSPETPYSGQPAEVSCVDVAALGQPADVATLTEEMQIETHLSTGKNWDQDVQLFDHTPCGENQLLALKRQTNELTEVEMKPKTALLFGKHESEIIHKLVLPVKRGVHSKPLTRDKLIIMPVEVFNTRLEQAQLSEIEVAFMKEWRRRGKNKAAAQTARKRKREEVSSLDQKVYNMRQQKTKLEKRCDELQSLVASLTARSKAAEDKLYERQSVITGQSVSQNTHHIHITEDDELLLIPRANNKIAVVN